MERNEVTYQKLMLTGLQTYLGAAMLEYPQLRDAPLEVQDFVLHANRQLAVLEAMCNE